MRYILGTEMQAHLVDFLVLRGELVQASVEKATQVASLLRMRKSDQFQKMVTCYNRDANIFYAYFYLNQAKLIPAVDKADFLGEQEKEFNTVEISRISIRNPLKGISCELVPGNRYVVEMDPETGWQEELFSWYDQEHLPGLASVPGCISASHCLNLDHAPYSFAFYDLRDPAVLGCDPWLKVRATVWSDRVRPHFTNTKRTMFDFI